MSKVKIQLIVAMDEQRGIGKNNDLMWHLPADMKFFKETTEHHIVVMGRKNYDSIPVKYRPLSNRENVVLTRNTNFTAENCVVFHSLEDCLHHYQSETSRILFIIGGGQIYAEALALDVVEEMYITFVHHTFGADTFFPQFDESQWQISEVFHHPVNERNPYAFTVKKYTRGLHR